MTTQSVAVAFTSPAELATAREWTLTTNAFELLLKHFDDNREEAARKYVSLYTKLTRYFDWRGSTMPDWHADETMTRIARRIEQGAVITNFQGFMFGVARKVAMEALKEREREQRILTYLSQADSSDDSFDQDSLLARVEAGLLNLTSSGRELLLAYYASGDDRNTELRRKLAADEGISLNALRIRVHRLKAMLETHVKPDLDSASQAKPTAAGGSTSSRATLYAV